MPRRRTRSPIRSTSSSHGLSSTSDNKLISMTLEQQLQYLGDIRRNLSLFNNLRWKTLHFKLSLIYYLLSVAGALSKPYLGFFGNFFYNQHPLPDHTLENITSCGNIFWVSRDQFMDMRRDQTGREMFYFFHNCTRLFDKIVCEDLTWVCHQAATRAQTFSRYTDLFLMVVVPLLIVFFLCHFLIWKSKISNSDIISTFEQLNSGTQGKLISLANKVGIKISNSTSIRQLHADFKKALPKITNTVSFSMFRSLIEQDKKSYAYLMKYGLFSNGEKIGGEGKDLIPVIGSFAVSSSK